MIPSGDVSPPTALSSQSLVTQQLSLLLCGEEASAIFQVSMPHLPPIAMDPGCDMNPSSSGLTGPGALGVLLPRVFSAEGLWDS